RATRLPTLEVDRAPGAIVLDGVLDDPGWRGAPVATHFAEHNPGDQVQPPVRTEAFMTYDDEHVYVAFRCYDDPAQVRASFCKRDNIFQDDVVFLCLDTFGDGTTGYEIAVNPYGIQGDLFFSAAGGEDIRFDLVYHTAARIDDQGWTAEFAIPFRSLRFPDRPEQVWRVDFWRNHPRAVRTQASWAAYDRDESCWPCQWGTVTGIRDVKPAAGLELIPAFTANQAGGRADADRGFANGDLMGEPSVTAKYALSSNAVAEATFNPDFSQVESDAAQIDVNTNFALFYPEKRPFFQEGADLFATWFEAIYTRSINDPSAAGKLTGRNGATSFAVLSAYDMHSPLILPFEERSAFISNGKSLSNVVRVKRELAAQTHLGLVATDRRYDGGGNGSLVGLDGRLRLDSRTRLEAQYLHSFTSEPDDTTLTPGLGDLTFDDGRHTAAFDGESFGGHALYGGFVRNGRDWSLSARYWDRSPAFRAENGFEVRNSYRQGTASTEYVFRFDDSEVWKFLAPGAQASRSWNYDGIVKDEAVQVWLQGSLRVAQLGWHAQYRADAERFAGRDYRGLDQWHICANARPSDLLALGGSANYGHRVFYGAAEIGRQEDYSFWCDLKPLDRLLLESSVMWSRSRHLDSDQEYFDGWVMRSRLGLQLTRELSLRLVLQYDDFRSLWEADPLVQYQLNPFSIFYVGSTRDYRLLAPGGADDESWRLVDRQYFLKLQYLFRV
ncbi:MAG: carbohydrate binding family 9 domain-containing protein, partial [Krumholzibacteria bacterium]|nr:carbohydrate binding family 9 domain-containing protein [Candidatus Krumholzibacteria bacterium]